MMYNTDLHIHPSMAAFGSGPDGALPNIKLYSSIPRNVTSGFLRCLMRIAPAQTKDLSSLSPTTQSDFSKLATGNFKLVGIVLGTMESGFTQINLLGHPKLKHFNRFVRENGRAKMVQSISGVHVDKVKYIRDQLSNSNDSPNYFSLFQKEVDYVFSHKNTTFRLEGNSYDHAIHFPENAKALNDSLENDNIIVGFFAIEGIQSIGVGLKTNGLEEDYLNRIRYAKNLDGILLYVSINHHFPNTLSGHAKTLGKTLSKMLSQQVDESRGICPDGYKVISALLDDKVGGKRILIDIKHFNLKSRQEFYAWYKQNYSFSQLPFICSHTGMTNKSWNDALNDPLNFDTDELNKNTYFHEWSVNLFKEDVWEVLKIGGLIGIQMDEKRLGGEVIWTKILHQQPEKKDAAFAELILANILSIVQTAYEFAQKEGLDVSLTLENAWASICIGSDFDGLVNPVDNVVTSEDLKHYSGFLYSRFDKSLAYSHSVHGWELTNSQIQVLLNGKEEAYRLQQILKENIPSFLLRVLPLMGYG